MNNIILIGFMGCGKTSIGKKISKELNFCFIDTDEWIEKREKKSISDIFTIDGEKAFREMETECIKELLTHQDIKPVVLSVGGGLILKEENRILLKKLGTVVFLNAKEDTIYERLKKDTTRPLLHGDNPREKILRMMSERKPIYMEACNKVFDVDNKSITECADEITKMMKCE